MGFGLQGARYRPVCRVCGLRRIVFVGHRELNFPGDTCQELNCGDDPRGWRVWTVCHDGNETVEGGVVDAGGAPSP